MTRPDVGHREAMCDGASGCMGMDTSKVTFVGGLETGSSGKLSMSWQNSAVDENDCASGPNSGTI